MNTKLTMLAVLAAGILVSTSQHVAAQANSPPDATATRPAKTPPNQTSMPNASPPATTDSEDGTDQPGSGRQRDEREGEGQGRAYGQIARAHGCRSTSAPLEVGRTLLVEGLHAFAAILGRNHAVVSLDLQRQPIAQ